MIVSMASLVLLWYTMLLPLYAVCWGAELGRGVPSTMAFMIKRCRGRQQPLHNQSETSYGTVLH